MPFTFGEFKKDKETLNVDLEEPSLTCDPNAIGKIFKVRFDAETYDKEKPDTTSVRWKCRKYGDTVKLHLIVSTF